MNWKRYCPENSLERQRDGRPKNEVKGHRQKRADQYVIVVSKGDRKNGK